MPIDAGDDSAVAAWSDAVTRGQNARAPDLVILLVHVSHVAPQLRLHAPAAPAALAVPARVAEPLLGVGAF